jgi:hypothetical protein
MAIPSIVINKQTGNLFRTSAALDAVTALVLDATAPAGFPNSLAVYSMRQVESAGITSAAYPAQHYQVSEFFRINPNGKLVLAFGDITSSTTFNVLRADQPRQIGYFTQDALTVTMVAAAQARALELEAAEAPASILLTADTSAIATAALPDLSGLGYSKVSVVIAQGGLGSTAASLATSTGKSVGAIGTLLGRLSLCKVSESVGFVQNGDVAGTELQEIAIGNGTAISDLSHAEQNGLDDKHYIFLLKYANLSGSYFNFGHTAASSDLNTIELNRVLDKAIRATRRALTPKLNASVALNTDGTIQAIYIKQFESLVKLELGQMKANDELSQFDVTINPAQNILSTNTLEVSVAIVPFGTSKNILVNIGFQTSL